MSVHLRPAVETLPSHAELVKATGVALLAAGTLLLTVVLPAEYGIDPTGAGGLLGLAGMKRGALRVTEPVATEPAAQPIGPLPPTPPDHVAPAAQAGAASVAPVAVSPAAAAPIAKQPESPVVKRDAPFRTDSISVLLLPGEGAEVKAAMETGDNFVFSWTTDGGLVDFEMHGEPSNNPKTSKTHWKDKQKDSGHGSFVAPFDGAHGWYWVNEGRKAVRVKVTTSGFYERLYKK
ncbi:MAG: hypothetical protein HYZ53_05200 [Planctomycetes bacterium]|nr:hypothetical protein [Planctomycetota bacterium]